MLRIVISSIQGQKVRMLTNISICQLLDDNKSMISNIYACRSISMFLQYYNKIKPHVIPRTLSIMSRRLSSLSYRNSIDSLQQKQRKILKQLINDIFNINCKMLSPLQCNNLLYFLRIFDQKIKQLQIDRQYVQKLETQLVQQIMMNVQYLSFNNLIDFLRQMQQRGQVYNKNVGVIQSNQNKGLDILQKTMNQDINLKNRKIIIKNIQHRLPQLETQVIDSLFHLTKLLTNLILQQKQVQKEIKNLFNKVVNIILKYKQYLPKYLMMDVINTILGNYVQMRNDPNFSSQILSILANLLRALASKMEKQQEVQYKNSSLVIKGLIKQIQNQKEASRETIMKICIQISNLKKIYYLQSQLPESDRKNYSMLNFRQSRKNNKRQPLYKHKDYS